MAGMNSAPCDARIAHHRIRVRWDHCPGVVQGKARSAFGWMLSVGRMTWMDMVLADVTDAAVPVALGHG